MSAQAGLAVSARRSWLEGDAVADFEGFYRRANFDNCSGRFMAEDHGVFDNKVANAAVFPVVDIAATDTGPIYGDEDMVRRFEFWFWLLFEGDVEGFVEHKGEILDIFVS